MKKLYRKGQVHPSPSNNSPSFDELPLSVLPATIFTLVTSLSFQDKQVLTYLLSCSINSTNKNNTKNNNKPHPPCFSCYCFTCYTYYWALWDSSPNRQLIHEIIDAFEDYLVSQNKKNKHGLTKREKRRNNNNNKGDNKKINGINHSDTCKVNDACVNGSNGLVRVNHEVEGVDSVEEETDEKQGSHVGKIVSFISERLWGTVWG